MQDECMSEDVIYNSAGSEKSDPLILSSKNTGYSSNISFSSEIGSRAVLEESPKVDISRRNSNEIGPFTEF